MSRRVMDERRLTVIMVPHGDLETRTYEISYGRLKLLLGIGGVLLLVIAFMAAFWWSIAAQAARVPGLEREVATLEAERRQVAELAETLAEVEEQYERVRQMLGADAAASGREPVLPPLRGGAGAAPAEPRESSHSGTPSDWPLAVAGYVTQGLTDRRPEPHPGMDIAVAHDTYIRATGPGIVRDAGDDPVYGLFVLIEHEDGYESMYGHASMLFVEPGDMVEKREVIALSGSTGRSTAPHLHFEIRRYGDPVDPLTLVRQP